MTSLDQFLEEVGATDLIKMVRHFNRCSAGNGRFQIQSERNQSVALVAQDDKLSFLFGIGDRNFAPLSVYFDHTGKADRVSIPNANLGRSGQTNFSANDKIIADVTNAARSMKSGTNGSTGQYAAQLARAAGALTPRGRTDWGTGLISEASAQDTATRDGSINAIAAVVQKWQQHIVFK